MKVASKPDILSGLKYHGHAVLIVHLDAGRFSAEDGKGTRLYPFLEANKLFTEACLEFRRTLKRPLEDIKREVPRFSDVAIDFDDFLYNPACFVALGDTDSIAILGVDEFEAASDLSSRVEVPVRQTCLAFCPELKSFLPKSGRRNGIFCELPDLYADPELALKQASKPDDIASCEHFLRDRPLLAVTYFKLNGTTALGPGLMMQEFAYKAMAERITKTLNLLRQTVDDHAKVITDGVDDIESFRCMFLDPQGWSDIATLMFCRNFSVAATVIGSLRCLTMDDLYRKSDREAGEGVSLREAVECFDVYRHMAHLGKETADPLLRANHVFCSTYTAAGIYQKSFENETVPAKGQPHRYSGLVIADTNLSVCAGHVLDVQSIAQDSHKPFELPAEVLEILRRHRHIWYMFGHNDFVYQQLADDVRDLGRAIDLAYLVRQIKALQDNPSNPGSGAPRPLATDLLDVCTDLRVPIPVLPEVITTFDHDRHMDIRSTLEKVRRRVFEKRGGYLSVEELSRCMRIVRVPSPLSSGIRYLYTDFANYLSDPFLFESVLDLYDIFAAFRTLLVEDLPALLKKRLLQELTRELGELVGTSLETELFADEQENLNKALQDHGDLRERLDSICLGFLSSDDLEELVQITDLLENALANRVQITFNAAERWNATVDARGIGLDRMISAADAPLKCGLGILRRVMNQIVHARSPGRPWAEIDLESRRRIGGASAITYDPRCFSKRLVVGDTPDIFIASVDLNLSHLTRPQAFYIHLHETAHLISYLLRDREGCKHPLLARGIRDTHCYKRQEPVSDTLDEVRHERYQEVFAEMLIHRFVFGNDTRLYFRNYVANYSLDPINFGADDDETFIRMLEVLLRGFLASDPFRVPELYSVSVVQGPAPRDETVQMASSVSRRSADSVSESCSGDVMWVPEPTDQAVKNALSRFRSSVEDAGPFLYDFRRLWHGKKKAAIRSFVEKQFERVYREAYHPVCCMWEDVREVCDIVKKDTYPDDDDTARALMERIRDGFATGTPVVRVKCRGGKNEKSQEEKSRLAPLFIVCTLLNAQIESLYSDLNTKDDVAAYLPRKTNSKPDPQRLGPDDDWNRAFLDRNFNGIVAADPEKRRKSMLNRIAVIKSFWDISTSLRARRLKDMLDLMDEK